jgi:hypothetical protein
MINKIKVGSTVEYMSVSGKRTVKVLKIFPNGNLSLDTRKTGLIKNVTVMPHRVKLIS